MLPLARAFAQKHGLSQDAFSELVDLHAAGQISSQQILANAHAAEVAKLGATGTARKTAVDTWIAAKLGEDLGKSIIGGIFTAKQVEAFEKLIANDRNQGGGTFSQTGREPPAGNGEIPGYDKMSFAEKRFAQDQMRANRGR